jgi:hypothetical protein
MGVILAFNKANHCSMYESISASDPLIILIWIRLAPPNKEMILLLSNVSDMIVVVKYVF